MNPVWKFLKPRWRGILLIAATYFYFLIYAQFGFLHRLSESVGSELWNPVLAVMGISGLFGALVTAYQYPKIEGQRWLLLGFVGCGGGAYFAAIGTHVMIFFLAAAVSGYSLALLTVALVGVLAEATPVKQIGLVCGLGTGLAYFFSNVPFFFEASPVLQCLLGTLASATGILLALGRWPHDADAATLTSGKVSLQTLSGILLVFLVLIWADSAAFTRIQTTPELKAISWSGTLNLWSIGIIHLLSAVLAGWLMDRRQSLWVYLWAFTGLLFGLLFLEAHRFGILPTLLYASAVSFYSTALVAFALVAPRIAAPVMSAGLVFGFSGWLGSAMGIGMEHDLGRVPLLFWVFAAIVLLPGLYLSGRRCPS